MATITDFGNLVSATGKGGGGVLGGLSNILGNRLFQQMLMAGGQSLLTRNVKPLADAFNQNQASQGYLGILQKILSGQMPGAGAKIDDKGLTVTWGRETPSGQAGPDPGMTGVSQLSTGVGTTPVGQSETVPQGSGQVPAESNNMMSVVQNLLAGGGGSSSPFNFSQISASDLAGVSPEMIQSIIQLKQNQDQLQTRKMSEIVNAMYNAKQMDYLDSQMMENKSQAEIARMTQNRLAAKEAFDQEVSADTSMREWYKALKPEDKSNFEKEYTFAKANGYNGTPAQWKTLSQDPTSWEEYQKAVGQGYKGDYPTFLLKYKKSDMNITLDPGERTRRVGSAQAEVDVTAPDFFSKVQATLSKDENWDRPLGTTEYIADQKTKGIDVDVRTAAARQQKLNVLKQMDLEINQAYNGKGTVEMRQDGWYLNGKLIVRNPYAAKR
jgi:hypothetical protein